MVNLQLEAANREQCEQMEQLKGIVKQLCQGREMHLKLALTDGSIRTKDTCEYSSRIYRELCFHTDDTTLAVERLKFLKIELNSKSYANYRKLKVQLISNKTSTGPMN
jgi:hypothetical protein